MTRTSPKMRAYFDKIKNDVFSAYAIASVARSKGYDPSSKVEVELAETLAERVVGLMSVVAPQIKGVGIEKRIEQLESEFGVLDWRVAMVIALEIAQEKFCKFNSQIEAIGVGIKLGFAYVTLGVVSSPIEGLVSIELKPRLDGRGKYFRLNYAGPIRNAGGTMAAVSVLIADYVRKHLGFDLYDPTEKEILRCPAELEDYHNYVTNLQYFPSKDESLFLMRHIPVEIAGDASEKRELSNINLKDLHRIETNNLRSGYCLIHSSCIPLKAPKLWARLQKWGEEMGLGHWSFLKDFIELQKRMKAKGVKKSSDKLSPDYTYIKDLVAGRPVLSYPLRPGGFRLRYGRSRASGYSGQSINPATMVVLDGFIATATQLKVERPGKAAAFTPCDSIEGPIVKLFDGSVVKLNKESDAKFFRNKIDEILFLGDVLINYGDFFDRAHTLVPPGYTPEFWVQEVKTALKNNTGSDDISVWLSYLGNSFKKERMDVLLTDFFFSFPTFDEALLISKKLNVPLHPEYTHYWTLLSVDELVSLLDLINEFSKTVIGGVVSFSVPLNDKKIILEKAGIPHTVRDDLVFFDDAVFSSFLSLFSHNSCLFDKKYYDIIRRKITSLKDKDIIDVINEISLVSQRDKAGVFIGSRMGRPEKAKMRRMTGGPHTLFPVGEEGGRLRSFQSAIASGKVKSAFPVRYCKKCNIETPLSVCELCDSPTTQVFFKESANSSSKLGWKEWEVPIKRVFDGVLNKLKLDIFPDLIKGVRGTSNKSHIPEHISKGILRAKHNICVNKDGTIRYDASEVTLTHFKPCEVGVSISRLKELGYDHDVFGNLLVDENQILELKPQDVVLPCCSDPDYPDEPCDEVLFRTASFVDELMVRLYGLNPFYDLRSKSDLVGHYIVGLAPHTSAGIVGRVVGFSQTQGFLAHPLFHAAMRRDCDGDESCFLLLMDVFLNFSRKYLPETRGATMDAPLVLTYFLNPAEVDDMAFNVDIVWEYPLDFYLAALEYKKPWDVKIKLIGDTIGKPEQFEGMGFTHPSSNINSGILCSAYKTLPSMAEKLDGQLKLAKKIRACDESDVARLVITKHFMRDTKGNLRKFSQQQFRCVGCNAKYRRPPIRGSCPVCGGRIIFTISEGSVIKYLEPSIRIAYDFGVPEYVKQDLELTKRRIESMFGKDSEKQEALGKFFQ